jgi:hypothetical protein
MSTYTLWDVHSTTLLVGTRSLSEIAASTDAYVRDNGSDALEDLVLGIEPDDTSPVQEHAGRQILETIKREQASAQSA